MRVNVQLWGGSMTATATTATTDPPPYPARPSGDPLTPAFTAGNPAIGQVRLPTGGLAWLVTRHEDVRAVPYSDHEFFQSRSRTMLAWSTPPEAARTAVDELRGYLAELVEARRGDPGDDLLSRLATEHLEAGTVTVAELAGLSLLLLIA